MRRPGLETRTVDGEIVILDLQKGNIHRLNSTASLIWGECDGTRTASEIAMRLAEGFEIPSSQALDDVNAALAELDRLGLLVEGG